MGAVALALSLFALIAASVHYGLLNLLGLTSQAGAALACCRTPFSWCLVSPTMFMTIIPWVGFGVVATGLLFALFRAAGSFIVSRRFVTSLNAVSLEKFPELKSFADYAHAPIIPFEDERLKAAFTLGLLRPRVYISTALVRELDEGELEAVVLHELNHAEKRDPLKLFVLSFIQDLLFFVPLGSYLSKLFHGTKEFAADERAVRETGKPFDLANALVKMMRMRRGSIPAGVQALDNTSLAEKRIKELLEPGGAEAARKPLHLVFTTALIVLTLAGAFAAPIYAGGRKLEKCNHDYCLSSEKACPAHLDHCKKSCDLMEKK
ncbi:MAG: M56 family metallopeptidase [Candidatus Nitrospinota bacterium M3_3B_026]